MVNGEKMLGLNANSCVNVRAKYKLICKCWGKIQTKKNVKPTHYHDLLMAGQRLKNETFSRYNDK